METFRSHMQAIYYPEELKFLRRVCRKMRKVKGVAAGDEGAKDIADLALTLYSAGICEERTLIRKLRQQA